jgi:Tol biopolymer transport system component
MKTDGSNSRVVVGNGEGWAGEFLPDYHIIFIGPTSPETLGIWETDTLGQTRNVVYEIPRSGQSEIAQVLRVSPDGSRIAFVLLNTKIRAQEIWTMNTGGSDLRRLCVDATDPSWSPDGSKLAFVKYNYLKRAPSNPGYGEIWTMDADGMNQRQVTFVDTENQGNPGDRETRPASRLPAAGSGGARRAELAAQHRDDGE